MALELAHRYEQISARAYEHPADRAATSALQAVPLLERVLTWITSMGHERLLRQLILGNAVRIDSEQVPEVWTWYVAAVRCLDLPDIPPLYVTNDAQVNAMTVGSNQPLVVVNASLLSSYQPAEVQTVLAHEAGHVLSEHNRYMTALVMIRNLLGTAAGGGGAPGGRVISMPLRALYYALLEWRRAAELSCDRAAALVTGDPLRPCQVLMRVAGGTLPGMRLEAFLRQAADYHEEEDLFARRSRFWAEMRSDHPFPVRRVRELTAWVQGGDFDRIRGGAYPRRGHEPPPSAELRSAVEHYGERFSQFLERASDDVDRVGRQLGDWLRRQTGGPGSVDVDSDVDPFGAED